MCLFILPSLNNDFFSSFEIKYRPTVNFLKPLSQEIYKFRSSFSDTEVFFAVTHTPHPHPSTPPTTNISGNKSIASETFPPNYAFNQSDCYAISSNSNTIFPGYQSGKTK